MPDIDLSGSTPYRLLTDEECAREAITRLQSEPLVSLDTETYWDAATKQARISLVQLTARVGEVVVVIDALAVGVESLRALVEAPQPLMVAHNARFDEAVLSGAGLRPAGFIDTLRMARLTLDLESYSLASVAGHLFGIALDKSLQTSNWRRRPLTPAQLSYAAADARVTLQVYESLREILEGEGRLEDVLRYATLAPSVPRERKRQRRIAPQVPSEPLNAEQQRVVAQLKKWRTRQANLERVPAYMICPDKTLEHLARAQPLALEELPMIYGLGESKIARFGVELLAALQQALN